MPANPPLRCSKLGETSPTAKTCLDCNIDKKKCIVKNLLYRVRELEQAIKGLEK